MEDSVKFFEDVIVNDDLGYNNLEYLFGLRCDCSGMKEEDEKELLNKINDILAVNQHKDLTDTIGNVNYMLRMSLYYDRRNKYEIVIFSVNDYKTPAGKRDIIFIPI